MMEIELSVIRVLATFSDSQLVSVPSLETLENLVSLVESWAHQMQNLSAAYAWVNLLVLLVVAYVALLSL